MSEPRNPKAGLAPLPAPDNRALIPIDHRPFQSRAGAATTALRQTSWRWITRSHTSNHSINNTWRMSNE